MKTVVKIILIFLGLLFLGGVILGSIANQQDGNRQSFCLLNTSNESKSTTFEAINKNGEQSNEWSIDEKINPGEQKITQILPGKYLVKVWNKEDKLENEFEFEFSLDNPNESNYNLYRFDLAMDKNFALVNMNALYEGNSLSNTLASALGSNQEQLYYEAQYKGNQPFIIPDVYNKYTFIDLGEELPSRKKIGETIYQLQIAK